MGHSRAVIIAGTHSGSGKTTLTLGLMAALVNQGYKVQPFKCGPDFIDPTLHRLVTGTISRNLDIWMSGNQFVRETYSRHTQDVDISVIEGVMGMFDGGSSSSATLATKLGIPVVLVLDVSSAAESAAAVLNGFESFTSDVSPKAVILNQIGSQRHLQLVSDAIRQHCKAEILGYLPRTLNFRIPERHLGLHMGEESPLRKEAVTELAKTVSDHIDLDRLMAIGEKTQKVMKVQQLDSVQVQARIAVARDKAFCFYYEDNLDLLRSAGAELAFFSPLADDRLPENISAIYLGGGYPELFAAELSENKKMLTSICQWAKDGGVIYAECGGFMYLSRSIVDFNEKAHDMAGIFPVQARMLKSLAALGYREIRLTDNCILGPAGTVLRGHEFHYSNIDRMPDEIERLYTVNNNTEEGYRYKNVLGGYMHLHFGFNPQALTEFVKTIQNSSI